MSEGRATDIDGVLVQPLSTHSDARGSFTELFRLEWAGAPTVVQWNVVTSKEGVLRGVHVHARHTDYLAVVSGHARVFLRDLRDDSPTLRTSRRTDLRSLADGALVIPPGVAHAFTFLAPSVHVYGVSHYWDTADELACHWADPELEFDWPFGSPLLSARDAEAGTVCDMAAELADARRGGSRS